MSDVNKLRTVQSKKSYTDRENKEHKEFKKFKDAMEPAKKLFEGKGVEFDIQFYTFKEFLARFEKTEDELNYLKRYTFE